MAKFYDTASGPEKSLLFLSRIGVHIHHLNKLFERRCGMSMVQWAVLKQLVDLPGTSAQELAGAAGVHPSTLTQTLKRLEAKKLIYVDEHPRDSRRKVLTVSRAGKNALDLLGVAAQSILSKVAQLEIELVHIDAALAHELSVSKVEKTQGA